MFSRNDLMHRVITDFASKELHENINNIMSSNKFPWFYQDSVAEELREETADEFYFTKAYSAEDDGTFTSLFIDNGLRITYKAKYSDVDAVTDNLSSDIGLDTSLHPALVCYVKARLFEDQGNVQNAQYFRQMYNDQMMKQRSRKSGVRSLSVPNM